MREKGILKHEEMKKVWRNTSILIVILTIIVVAMSLASGESRLMLFRRVAWIYISIATFFIGLVAGVKMVYRLKTGEMLGEENIPSSEDGVTK